MHVAVDGRSLRPGTGRARGVARYLRCLLEELARAFPEDTYTVVDPGSLRLAASAVTGRPRLDRLAPGCDLAWLPSPAPVAVSHGVPLVLTVHDLSFEHRPGDYSLYDRGLATARQAGPPRAARGARAVRSRRRRGARWWPSGVSGGPHADGPSWGRAARRERRGRVPAGGPGEVRAGRRGTRATQAAWPARRGAPAGAAPVACAPASCSPATGRCGPSSRAPERPCSATCRTPYSTALYERALAVSCVSREEGFGFTPLEALARGTPAMVSDLPVFAETVGDGALRVPLGDAAALANALLRLEREPCCASAGPSGQRGGGAAVVGGHGERHPGGVRGGRRVSGYAIVTVIHDSAAGAADPARLHRAPSRAAAAGDRRGQRLAGPRPRACRRARGGADPARRQPGFGAGCNAGLELVTEPVTAFVNPDVELLDDGLRGWRARRRGGALLAPRLLNADGSVQDSAHPLPGRLGTLLPALLPRPLLPPPLRRRSSHGERNAAAVGWAMAPASSAGRSGARSARSTRRVPVRGGHGPVPTGPCAPGSRRCCTRRSRYAIWAALDGPALGDRDLAVRARRAARSWAAGAAVCCSTTPKRHSPSPARRGQGPRGRRTAGTAPARRAAAGPAR